MTQIHKDFNKNWRAQDSYELGNMKVLQITTSKVHSGAIVTSATVHIRDGAFMSHRMFTDFSQRLMTAQVRCTEKNVAAQHADAVSKLAEIKEAVTAWYSREETTA